MSQKTSHMRDIFAAQAALSKAKKTGNDAAIKTAQNKLNSLMMSDQERAKLGLPSRDKMKMMRHEKKMQKVINQGAKVVAEAMSRIENGAKPTKTVSAKPKAKPSKPTATSRNMNSGKMVETSWAGVQFNNMATKKPSTGKRGNPNLAEARAEFQALKKMAMGYGMVVTRSTTKADLEKFIRKF